MAKAKWMIMQDSEGNPQKDREGNILMFRKAQKGEQGWLIMPVDPKLIDDPEISKLSKDKSLQ